MVSSVQYDLKLYNENSWSKLSDARQLPASNGVNIKDEESTLMGAVT
jgi:hypothetical protein